MFIDTHCHISKKYYPDIDKLIHDNMESGAGKIIISCCEKDDIQECLDLLKKYDIIYATFGFHPDQVEVVDHNDIKYLEEIIMNTKKIIGIGEIGLDYHYEVDKDKQKRLFEKQLSLAEKLNLPVVIHSRDATKDTIDILKKYKVKGIIHCFSGSLETAKIYIKMGYKLGIGGVVTFKNSKLKDVVEQISIHDIVLETDSPYLTPDPFRGKRNSSKYIPIIIKKIASIKNISENNVEKITTENCDEVFDLRS